MRRRRDFERKDRRCVKLATGLSDLFQHCQVWCTAECCRWRAFDFTEHWLLRWCEFREPREIERAIAELDELLHELEFVDREREVWLEGYFVPPCGELVDRLTGIRGVLVAFRQSVT